GCISLNINVILFTESVTFITRLEIPDSCTVAAHFFSHLLRLRSWYPWVVSSLQDKQRPGNFTSVIYWRYGFKKSGHRRVAFVPVFNPSKVAPVTFCIFQECIKIRNAHNVYRTTN